MLRGCHLHRILTQGLVHPTGVLSPLAPEDWQSIRPILRVLSCHPGVCRTLTFLQQHWWPSINKDVRDYVAACSICAQNKSSSKPPSGLLHPLCTPHRPWSHIALDFITGLPVLSEKSVILTIVDRFSKSAHFIVTGCQGKPCVNDLGPRTRQLW